MNTPCDKKLVSIILPTFNGERFIEHSVRSCLRQTWPAIELIVVDDASTDATPKILSRLAGEDTRIMIIRHDRNRKLPKALNTGFALARGEYFTWTSDDNEYLPNAIETMTEYLEARKDTDIVYGDYRVIDEKGNYIKDQKVLNYTELIDGNCIGACFLYRREVQEKVGSYAEDLFLAEDYDFWLRASACCRMARLDQILYGYRNHQKSLTQTHSDGRGRKVCDRALERNLSKLNWLNDGRKGAVFLRLAQYARWRADHWMMVKCLVQGWRYSPGRTGKFLLDKLWKNKVANV